MAAPESLGAAEQTRTASGQPSPAMTEHGTYTLPTGAYPVYEANATSERVTHAVALLMLVYTAGYIVWRWLFTLNPAAYWFSIPLALAETYGFITAFFMTYTTWTLKRRVAPPAPKGQTVDVFVTTYDEPLNVIRKTALAAREIRYPHETYILDDGKRDEIRSLAEDLGVRYLRRPDNKHAKAGNLNHALSQSSGDFILQLDADHVPQPHILDRLLGFFADDKVALAQSPQDFYNTDAFTYDVNETARRIWEDQQLFFRVIQPGKDARDAAFFVGSCAVLRRKALNDVGGFATTTITEDIETSLLLHSKGWKSVFYGETLAYGLAPGSAAAFHVQHLRWGQGAMQALRRYQPLTMRGLTLAQRIGYFDSLTTYFSGFQRLVFYLAPVIFFLTGAFPVRAGALQFLLIFAPYIALQFLAFKLLSRGHGSLLLADRYGMAKFFTHLMAVTAYFSKGALKFKVTPKGITDVPFRTYAPQLALAVLTAIAVLWGVLAASLHLTSYEVPGWGSLAFYVNLVFAGWTFYSSMYIVDMSVRLKTQRQDHRYAETMPVEVKVLREGRHVRATLVAVTNDLNPTGLSFRSSEEVEDGAWVEMRLPLLTRPVDVKGRVVHRRTVPTTHGDMHHHGVEFVALPWEVRDAIELHCAHYTTPLRRQRYVQAFSAVGDAMRWVRDPRRDKRASVGMPVDVELRSGTNWATIGLGLWEDVSETGARLLLGEALGIGDHIRARVRATGMQFDGDVVFVRTLETALGARFVIGLRRPRSQPVKQVSPETRGTPVNWNKFDRLLNRTRTDAAASGAAASTESTKRTPAGNAHTAPAETNAPAPETLRPAAATNVQDGQHVEVLRPKSRPLFGRDVTDLAAAQPDTGADDGMGEDEAALDSAEAAFDADEAAFDADAAAFEAGSADAALADALQEYVDAEAAAADGAYAESASHAAHTDDAGDVEPFAPEPVTAEGLDALDTAEPAIADAEIYAYGQHATDDVEAPVEPEVEEEEAAPVDEPPLPRWMAGVEPEKKPAARSVSRAPQQAASRSTSMPLESRELDAQPRDVRPLDAKPAASYAPPMPPITPAVPPVAPPMAPPVSAPIAASLDFSTPLTPPAPAPNEATPFTPDFAARGDDMTSHTTPFENTDQPNQEPGADEMMTEQLMQAQNANANYGPPSETSMLTVWGGGARLDGKFDIEDSIEVRCEIIGELNVGGRIVIEEGGVVNATVRTVDAEVRGTFTGDLIAAGSVHITETGRVTGNIQTEELIIARGGFFNGNVTRPEVDTSADNKASQARQQQARNGGGSQRPNGNAARRPNGSAESIRPRAETNTEE